MLYLDVLDGAPIFLRVGNFRGMNSAEFYLTLEEFLDYILRLLRAKVTYFREQIIADWIPPMKICNFNSNLHGIRKSPMPFGEGEKKYPLVNIWNNYATIMKLSG